MSDLSGVVESLSSSIKFVGKAGSLEYRFNCPFCTATKKSPDTKGHLYVNPTKGVFFCFRCEETGPIEFLFKKAGIPMPGTAASHFGKDLGDVVSKLSGFLGVADTSKLQFPCDVYPIVQGSEAWTYLRARGVTEAQMVSYRLKVGETTLFREGRDPIPVPRIFFPCYSPDGKTLIYWVGRTFLPEHSDAREYPKYLNPKGASRQVFFGWDHAARHSSVLITEGPMSCIAAGDSALATLGKGYTEVQLHLLCNQEWEEYIVAYDGDAEERSIMLARDLVLRGKNVSVVWLPDGEDPASVKDFQSYVDSRVHYDLAGVMGLLLRRKNG